MPQPASPSATSRYPRVHYAVARNCLAGMLVTYISIGLGTGDSPALVWISAITLAGVVAFELANGRVPANLLLPGALTGIIAAAASTNFFLTVGGGTLIFTLTAAMLVFWEVPSGRVATALIGFLFVVPVVSYGLGLGEGSGTATPEWSTVAIAAVWTTIYAAISMEHARVAYAAAYDQLATTEARISEEVATLRTQSSEQRALNAQLVAEATALDSRLEGERAATQRLRDALGDREQLTAAIRSDLREPLRSITSFSQLLRRRLTRDLPDGRASDYLAFAEDGGRRMAGMVDDLLRYTQADHDEALVPVELSGVVAAVRANLADQIERTGTRLQVGELPVLRGYPTQLLQLVQNIVSNAIKFARPGVPPAISITVGEAGADVDGDADVARVTIADNGRGIPANQLDEVFGLFNRSGNVGEVEGSGVGLALCRRIAIAHGGGLTVTSVAGEGTAFHFTCPMAEMAETARPPAPSQTLLA